MNNSISPRIIPLGAGMPQRGNALSQRFGIFLLWLTGWKVSGILPDTKKAVVIVAPHTSNYDAVVVVGAILALRMKISFFVKHSAFRWPFGGIMRWFGALPVQRDDSQDLVGFSAQKFAEKDELLLAAAPEGTRHAASHWKTGFYWIAMRAQVPVVMVGLDYAKKEILILKTLMPSGDIDADMAVIIRRYRGITACRPERLSAPLRALQEKPPQDGSGQTRAD
jgi:1-acyl-sn-glycerol-3-phosphate acyltransferase